MWYNRFPVEYQMDSQDCGPASLKMIAKHYGRYYSLQYLRDRCGITKEGVSMKNLAIGAEAIGLRSLPIKCRLSDLVEKIPFPAIAFWKQNHYVVVYHATRKHVYVSDPMHGRVKYTHQEFEAGWIPNGELHGVLLCVEVTADFATSDEERKQQRDSMLSLLRYFHPYKGSFGLIFVVMLLVTLIQALLPFISKAVIDVGIKTSDTGFINMILIGNAAILISVMIFNIIRDWMLMHITARVNIALISDYLNKLMKLPISFFETKLVGDILQRAHDHERIRNFIMNNSLALVFSVFTFAIFSVILLIYSLDIFLIFISGSVMYVGWILLFLSIRKKLDWQYFELVSRDQSYWVETVEAMADIKIYNYERARRWRWEEIQARLYNVNKRVLSVTNMQNLGAQFIESIKNMAITFFCATAVIKGDITFGVMISTQFIIGMLNGPLVQFINFVVSAQYAKISFFRMNEIRQLDDEEALLSVGSSISIPEQRHIYLNNVHFQYNVNAPLILKGINLIIPEKKITAIVGGSGSGKSTLLKLLVRLYSPSYGEISMGGMNVNAINLRMWREMIGVVMQDGKLFNDTIQANITLDDDHVDYDKLRRCCRIAQIENEINAMDKGFDTKIGEGGRGISGGQRQRLLIARALYREPQYLFLDEATNALDAINERKIVEALNSAFQDRTVVVIAHRLSTIRHADQIVVLDQGTVVEVGSHDNLIERQGYYSRLVTSQTSGLL